LGFNLVDLYELLPNSEKIDLKSMAKFFSLMQMGHTIQREYQLSAEPGK